MPIRIDLNTKHLSDDHRVFMARPGEGCKHFHHFREMSAIGPDFPCLKIGREHLIDQHENMEEMLKRSLSLKRWKPMSPDDEPPSEHKIDYNFQQNTPSRSSSQYRATLRGYFEVAKQGDLVLIPPSGWQSDALLVEFSTGPSDFVYRKLPYGTSRLPILLDVPVRKFREISTLQKRLLPTHVLDVIGKPSAFIEFGERDRITLQNIAYNSISKETDYCTTFHIPQSGYSLEHDLLFSAFAKFVAVNCKALSDNRDTPISFEQSLLTDIGEYSPTLQSNVNSPGWLKLRDHHAISLVAGVLFALCPIPTAEVNEAVQNSKIVIGNSKAPDDDTCVAEVSTTSIDFLNFINLDEWSKACEAARKVIESTGMYPSPRILEK